MSKGNDTKYRAGAPYFLEPGVPAQLPAVKMLWLGKPIHDAAVPYLARMKSLEHLSFDPGEVSDEALARLKQALPNCTLPVKK